MKVVILSGGFGTRISEFTSIIEHIMEIYSNFGYEDFYLALGYKAEVIKEYFYKYEFKNTDFKINLRNGESKSFKKNSKNWEINLIDTGTNTMTGGRLKRLEEYIGDETFLLTYGDAVTDLNINEVIKFHKKHGKIVTITGVRPPARFGAIKIS